MKIKKKEILTAAVISGALLLGGCGVKLGEEDTREVNALENVSLILAEDSIKATELTYTIDNQSKKDLSYGRDYGLEMEKDGKWYYVIPEYEVAITLELLWVPAGSSDTMSVVWGDSYGTLPAGHYRLIKPVSDNEQGYLLAGEFTISE